MSARPKVRVPLPLRTPPIIKTKKITNNDSKAKVKPPNPTRKALHHRSTVTPPIFKTKKVHNTVSVPKKDEDGSKKPTLVRVVRSRVPWPTGVPRVLIPKSMIKHNLQLMQNQQSTSLVSKITNKIKLAVVESPFIKKLTVGLFFNPNAKFHNLTEKVLHGEMISNEIKLIQCGETELLPIPYHYKGVVNMDQFEDALDVYENNQCYYLEHIENKPVLINDLLALEKWFVLIVEPEPIDADYEDMVDRYEREYNKLVNQRSGFCDPDLEDHIKDLGTEIRIQLVELREHLQVPIPPE